MHKKKSIAIIPPPSPPAHRGSKNRCQHVALQASTMTDTNKHGALWPFRHAQRNLSPRFRLPISSDEVMYSTRPSIVWKRIFAIGFYRNREAFVGGILMFMHGRNRLTIEGIKINHPRTQKYVPSNFFAACVSQGHTVHIYIIYSLLTRLLERVCNRPTLSTDRPTARENTDGQSDKTYRPIDWPTDGPTNDDGNIIAATYNGCRKKN